MVLKLKSAENVCH